MFLVDRTATVLKPTQKFLDWLQKNDPDFPDLTLPQLQANCTTYLLPEQETPEQTFAYISEFYKQILIGELATWSVDETLWESVLNLSQFWDFFTLEVHDTVVDLTDSPINNTPIMNTAE